MNKKWLKRLLSGAIPLAIIIIGVSYYSYVKMHTFTLSGDDKMKNEQIQPVHGSVKVNSTADTDVVFTDMESGKTYTIGYITSGMGHTIQLERDKWYSVEGAGELTMWPINVRIE